MIKKYLNWQVGLVVGFFVLSLTLSFFNLYYANKILPGIYLNGVDYGGLNRQEAVKKMKDELSGRENIEINVGTSVNKVSHSSVNLKYNYQETFDKLFSQGRDSYFLHLKYTAGYFLTLNNFEYDYSINEEALSVKISDIASSEFPKNTNAYFTFNGDDLAVHDAYAGKTLNSKKLYNSILKDLPRGKLSYSADFAEYKPEVFASDLRDIKPLVENFIESPLVLTYDLNQYEPSKNEKLKFLDFSKNNNSVSINPNSSGVSSYINFISSEINRDPKASSLSVTNEGVNFDPPVKGVKVEKDKMEKEISSYINNFNFNNTNQATIKVVVTETKPEISSNEYGITELLAEGVSHFRGSGANRIHNIATASSKIKGTLVAPGENFSFNEAVGPITLESGFNQGYIISKGETTLGTGGGVCQVSTTVYRAVLNSGLPIEERTAHAYRVSYYEQKSPVGLDATIYQPTVDLVFKNTTDHHILVYTQVDIQNTTLRVRIYGTSDGRQVKVTKPKMISEIPPPEPRYIDDPSLPEGQVIQKEYATWGGTVEYERIVRDKDGEVMFKDEFRNYYTPWAAVYRRGV